MVDPMPDPDDCFGCTALREENARLREERDGLPMAERLRRAEIVAGVTGTYREQLTCIDVWLNRREPVKYESATLRHVQEEVERLTRERDEARAEVEAERAYADASNQDAIAAEAEVEQWKRNVDLTGAELRDAETAVARLEGLILAWDREYGPDELLEAEARRIRAQREEGRCSAGVKGCGILFDEHGHTEEGQ